MSITMQQREQQMSIQTEHCHHTHTSRSAGGAWVCIDCDTTVEREQTMDMPFRTVKIEGKVVVIGASRDDLEHARTQCIADGVQVISNVEPYGRLFAFTCIDPDEPSNGEVRMHTVGMQTVISGHTEAAVTRKVNELVAGGARLVAAATKTDDAWTAICDNVDQLRKW